LVTDQKNCRFIIGISGQRQNVLLVDLRWKLFAIFKENTVRLQADNPGMVSRKLRYFPYAPRRMPY
jgi:hypothetical protein